MGKPLFRNWQHGFLRLAKHQTNIVFGILDSQFNNVDPVRHGSFVSAFVEYDLDKALWRADADNRQMLLDVLCDSDWTEDLFKPWRELDLLRFQKIPIDRETVLAHM